MEPTIPSSRVVVMRLAGLVSHNLIPDSNFIPDSPFFYFFHWSSVVSNLMPLQMGEMRDEESLEREA